MPSSLPAPAARRHVRDVDAVALSVFLVSTAILWLGRPNGAILTVAKVVATGSLIVWSLDELVRGVNPWRRLLGIVVLIYEVSTVRL